MATYINTDEGNYTILYYTILYYTILYYTTLYYTILYYTILHYTILYLGCQNVKNTFIVDSACNQSQSLSHSGLYRSLTSSIKLIGMIGETTLANHLK